MRSAPASDAMKMLVVERMPRLIVTDIMTREFPRVPKNMDTTLAIVSAMTADKGLSCVALVKFFSSVVLLNNCSMS